MYTIPWQARTLTIRLLPSCTSIRVGFQTSRRRLCAVRSLALLIASSQCLAILKSWLCRVGNSASTITGNMFWYNCVISVFCATAIVFVLKVVGTDRNIADWVLEYRANILSSFIKFFHKNLECMSKLYDSKDNFRTKLYYMFETYLKVLMYGGNMFSNIPSIQLPKVRLNFICVHNLTFKEISNIFFTWEKTTFILRNYPRHYFLKFILQLKLVIKLMINLSPSYYTKNKLKPSCFPLSHPI